MLPGFPACPRGQVNSSQQKERRTACFGGPRPFRPVTRDLDRSSDWRKPRIPAGRFFAVLLVLGGGLVMLGTAAPVTEKSARI